MKEQEYSQGLRERVLMELAIIMALRMENRLLELMPRKVWDRLFGGSGEVGEKRVETVKQYINLNIKDSPQ